MTTSSADRFARAALSLDGLSVGDAFGEQFFVSPSQVNALIAARTLPDPEWYFTDDTQMALSIISILRQYEEVNRDILAMNFGARYNPGRGYGPAMNWLLPHYWQGGTWPDLAPRMFDGQGSFGNGGAMRVAPVGAYFADDLEAVAVNAAYSCEVTHAHSEAVAGAVAVALGAAWAWRLRDADELQNRQEFLERILADVPSSEVRERLTVARDLPEQTTVEAAVERLGSGYDVTAQDTVPFALWCAGQHLGSYEEALWLTVSGLGDRDTTCAMVGGIVALSAGADSIPALWKASREPLPRWPFQETSELK